jgi:hypothetical protein
MAEEPKKKIYEPHSPVKVKYLSWMVCRCCGLIYLNNPATRAAIKKGHEVWN